MAVYTKVSCDQMKLLLNKYEVGNFLSMSEIQEGVENSNFKIFTDKPRVVKYKCIEKMGDSIDDVTWITFTAVAENGTLGAMWKAAESCFQQAKLAIGDWHYFVEDFEMQDDGTLNLVTGS